SSISATLSVSVSSRSFRCQAGASVGDTGASGLRSSSMGSLLAIHVDSVFAINLLEVDLHLLDECGGDVLAHEIRSNREFAVATIDEDGQANAGRPSKIQQRIEGRADAPAGKEDIVHEDDGRAIDGHGNFAWTNRRRCRPARHIVA